MDQPQPVDSDDDAVERLVDMAYGSESGDDEESRGSGELDHDDLGRGQGCQMAIARFLDRMCLAQIQRIQLVYSYSLCHLKCSHFEQEKHSDWSNGIG